MFKVIIAAVVLAAAFAVYKLWKAGKPVTTRNVIAGVQEEAKKAVAEVKEEAKKAVTSAKKKLKK